MDSVLAFLALVCFAAAAILAWANLTRWALTLIAFGLALLTFPHTRIA